MTVLQLQLRGNLYAKDPQSTDLGLRILSKGIELIDKLGFEAFTFKKLSAEIDSTEASVYRYFENKHRFLVYIMTWYWAWLEYRIQFETHNIENPKRALDIALKIISQEKKHDDTFPNVDEPALQRIVIAESDKTYLTKQVDEDNKEGLFKGYKSLCKLIVDLVKKVNPDFQYPSALCSMILEAANQQIFFANHLPSLTELSKERQPFDELHIFINTVVFKTISQ
jgi:AcrR family transcriptional regulator